MSARSDRPGRWRPSPIFGLTAGASLAGAAGAAAFPESWPWFAGAVLANHTIFFGAGLLPRTRLLGPNLSRLPEEAGRRNEVALTFDDGPDPHVTPAVLRILAERRIRATFFCIGERAERHGDLVAEIARGGHRVENHTYRHPHSFALYPPRRIERELARAQEVLEKATGRTPEWFRAPAGIRAPWLEAILQPMGLTLASWTRRGYDAVDGNPDRVLRRLTRGVAPGDVLLLHDGSPARAPENRPVCLEVLPRLLDALEATGLRPVPLSLAAAPVS